MTTFAWRLITDDLLPYSASSSSHPGLEITGAASSSASLRKFELNENQILQLKGIFLHYDTDRDGLLTVEQLSESLQSLGFTPRNKFLIKFLPNINQLKIQGKFINPTATSSTTATATATATATVTAIASSAAEGLSSSSSSSKLSFKTDFKTFTTVIGKEITKLQNLENELSSLFQFVDINRTGYLSKRELKYLLVDILSPSRLTATEFTKFMKSLKTFFDSNDNINITDLKRQLILYHC